MYIYICVFMYVYEYKWIHLYIILYNHDCHLYGVGMCCLPQAQDQPSPRLWHPAVPPYSYQWGHKAKLRKWSPAQLPRHLWSCREECLPAACSPASNRASKQSPHVSLWFTIPYRETRRKWQLLTFVTEIQQNGEERLYKSTCSKAII